MREIFEVASSGGFEKFVRLGILIFSGDANQFFFDNLIFLII